MRHGQNRFGTVNYSLNDGCSAAPRYETVLTATLESPMRKLVQQRSRLIC